MNLIIAFSPLSGYSQQTPLNLYPGEQKQITINVYPAPEEGSVSVEATILEGMNIASITDSSKVYDASIGNPGIVHVNVKIPSNTPIGTEYIVRTRFVNKNPKPSSGTVSFAVESVNIFKVVVVEKPPVTEETPATETPQGNNLIWWVIGIIVVVAIIYFIIKRKK